MELEGTPKIFQSLHCCTKLEGLLVVRKIHLGMTLSYPVVDQRSPNRQRCVKQIFQFAFTSGNRGQFRHAMLW